MFVAASFMAARPIGLGPPDQNSSEQPSLLGMTWTEAPVDTEHRHLVECSNEFIRWSHHVENHQVKHTDHQQVVNDGK